MQRRKFSLDSKSTVHSKAFICSQLWILSADDVKCPDFSGQYGIQFTPACNDDTDTDSINQQNSESCSIWIEKYDKIIDLSTELTWIDEICDAQIWTVHFGGIMTFYDSSDFSADPVDTSHLYQVGEDRIFVQIEVEVPSGEYDVFEAKLINVWLCTTSPSTGEPELDINTGTGGCLGDSVDDDGPYYIIENYDEVMLYNASHHDEDDPDKPPNVVRFSFVTPVSIVRDTLYIHAQLTLSLVDATRRRLAEASGNIVETTDQIKHYVGEVSIDTTGAKPYQHIEEIEEYKKTTGFYDNPLNEENEAFLDELGDDESNIEHYNYNQEPPNGGPYIVMTGDVFNVLKIVCVVIGFLVVANICMIVYWRYNKYTEEEQYLYGIQHSEYE